MRPRFPEAGGQLGEAADCRGPDRRGLTWELQGKLTGVQPLSGRQGALGLSGPSKSGWVGAQTAQDFRQPGRQGGIPCQTREVRRGALQSLGLPGWLGSRVGHQGTST